MANRFQITGGYSPSELHATIVASKYTSAFGGRVVVYCHGAGGNGVIEGTNPDVVRADLEHHANKGMVIQAALQDAAFNWGRAGAMTAISNALTYANTTYGANISRVLMIADSHGAAACLNWAVRNEAQFAGGILRVPAYMLQHIHDNNIAGLAAGMETAYGGLANLVAAYPTRDACHATFIANFNSISGLAARFKVMYHASDPIIPSAKVLEFTNATGVQAVDMGAVDHAPWGYFNILEQYQWLASHT